MDKNKVKEVIERILAVDIVETDQFNEVAEAIEYVDYYVRIGEKRKIFYEKMQEVLGIYRNAAESGVPKEFVDFALVNRVQPGDIVITQDYGLASMCLARQATVMHQDGWLYTADNIDALLFQRHTARKHRAAGGRFKGPAKRTQEQDRAFSLAFGRLLQQTVQG